MKNYIVHGIIFAVLLTIYGLVEHTVLEEEKPCTNSDSLLLVRTEQVLELQKEVKSLLEKPVVLIIDKHHEDGKIPFSIYPLDECEEMDDPTKEYFVVNIHECNSDTITYDSPAPEVRWLTRTVKEEVDIDSLRSALTADIYAAILDTIDRGNLVPVATDTIGIMVSEERIVKDDTSKRDLYKGWLSTNHQYAKRSTRPSFLAISSKPSLHTDYLNNEPVQYESVFSMNDELPRQVTFTYSYKTAYVDKSKRNWGNGLFWVGKALELSGVIWNETNRQQDPATLVYEDGLAPDNPANSNYSRNISEMKRLQSMKNHDTGSTILWGVGEAMQFGGHYLLNNSVSFGVNSVHITIPIK